MDRIRRGLVVAVFVVPGLVSAGIATAASVVPPVQPMAAVAWGVSSLVVSELQTGGASASDEFVEIANAGSATVDLAGLEVAYVTASGSTVTRKATWAESRPLAPGQRILLANSSGTFAPLADLAYSGGFAATGGALVLRPVGGAPIDAVGWGDATNAFVEGSSAAAPPAGSSLERRPGGAAGNGTDTNDNAADWFVQAAPSPQNLASAPVPAPTASPTALPTPDGSPSPTSSPIAPPSPTPTPDPTSTPVPTPTPFPTPVPTPTPTPVPTTTSVPSPSVTPTPIPTPTAVPTATPTPTPTPTAPVTPIPTVPATPSMTPAPTPSSPVTSPIANVRGLSDGAAATILGTLTTRLGLLEDGRTAFVQDATAGIALYLDAAPAPDAAWPVGTTVQAHGVVGSRFGQRVLRVAPVDLVATGSATIPPAIDRETGTINESVEGVRVAISGLTVGSPSSLSDGLGLWVDDGSGQVRAIISPDALGGLPVPAGTPVEVRGPVGQRDSTGTGSGGYRVHVTEPGDFAVIAPPSPSPSPTPTPAPSPTPGATASPTPRPTPSPTPAPTASRSPSPSPSGDVATIATARLQPIGALVTVSGVVTAPDGRLGTVPLIAIQDATAGIAVRLPDAAPRPAVGARVTVTGKLRDPYGQLEVRPEATGFRISGAETPPVPIDVAGAALGEATEGRLVVLEGTVDGRPKRSSSGDVTIALTAADGSTVRVLADASSRVDRDAVVDGGRYRLTGVVGQRASAKGTLDGYRLCLRGSADIVRLAPPPAASPTPGPSESNAPSQPTVLPISQALLERDGTVRVEGTVTAGASLLDASGRRIVVEDASAAVEVLLPSGVTAPAVGSRLTVSGTIGRAYGAPRLRAKSIESPGSGALRMPLDLRSAPGPAHEWRLVRVSGTIVDVTRMGSRWRAELDLGSARVPITGMTGAGIPSTSLEAGRRATVVGIVRRAYPSATDRRFSILPRGPADLAVGPVERSANGGGRPDGTSGAGSPAGPPGTGAAVGSPSPLDADLADLEPRLGQAVRVGGLVVELEPDGFRIDDGTAIGRVVLDGEAAEYLPLIEPGDALNATGRVERLDDELIVRVADPAGIVRVGDLPPLPSDAPSTTLVEPSTAPDAARAAGFGDPLGLGLPGAAGLASLVLVSIASVAVTLLRRQRTRRLLLARVAERVAAIAGERDPARLPPAPEGPPEAVSRA